jgi:hypothetical protein
MRLLVHALYAVLHTRLVSTPKRFASMGHVSPPWGVDERQTLAAYLAPIRISARSIAKGGARWTGIRRLPTMD